MTRGEIDRLVKAWQETESAEIAQRLYPMFSHIPIVLGKKNNQYNPDWVIGEAWFAFLAALKNYDPTRSKRGFESYFLQRLYFRCMRSWRDEDLIKIPVDLRSKIKHTFSDFEDMNENHPEITLIYEE